MKSSATFLFFVTTFIPLLTTTAAAQSSSANDSEIGPLTEQERRAISGISEGTVLSTVSFLSSDELAGRDTPSPELRIASAYVAARFRGAGLQPPDESADFYQESSYEVFHPPQSVRITSPSDSPGTITAVALCGTDETIEMTGQAARNPEQFASSSIAVLDEIDLPPGAQNRLQYVLAAVSRSVRRATSAGARVVVIRCAAQSVLFDVAAALTTRGTRYEKSQLPQCAVVLVDAKTQLEGRELEISVGPNHVVSHVVSNVVGVLRGSDADRSQEAIVVSAHLDHIGLASRGADRINNGADDNASGVTAVVTMADAFSRLAQPPARTVIFVAFWGEEKGLLGSRAFVQSPPWPLDRIVANVNIEMIGRPAADAHGRMWMTGWKHSNLGNLMNAGSQRVGVEVFDRTDIGEMLYRRSDNYSFVEVGVVAHSFSAGSLHSDYHQPTDEWTKLNIDHMTKIIRGLTAGTLGLAGNSVKISAESE